MQLNFVFNNNNITLMINFRVGDRNKYEIHLPLPPKIDPTVTMMQVRITRIEAGGWHGNYMYMYCMM